MSAATTPYRELALRSFPETLVQLVRSGAPYSTLRAEGFSQRQIDAVRVLVRLDDSTEPLDPGNQAGGDARSELRSRDEGNPVTGIAPT